MPNFIEGEVLLIDKPLTWTSFDAVNKLKYALQRATGLKKIKVGHAGTLDPLASGLLIICTGKKTKSIESYQNQIKEYTGTFVLGSTTPSYDLETEINEHFPTEHISDSLIHGATEKFIGKIVKVLVEGAHEETDLLLQGRHQGQAPDIDGKVIINDGWAHPGEIVDVEITEVHEYDLVGRIVK